MNLAFDTTNDNSFRVKGFYGSKLHLSEQGLVLVISYDDIDGEDLGRFCESAIEVTFKKIGLVTVFLFDFQQYLVDAGFDLFATYTIWKEWYENETELWLDVIVCDSFSGNVLGKREVKLPASFCQSWIQMMKESYKQEMWKYQLEKYQQQLSGLYDNHSIDEIYQKEGERVIRCAI